MTTPPQLIPTTYSILDKFKTPNLTKSVRQKYPVLSKNPLATLLLMMYDVGGLHSHDESAKNYERMTGRYVNSERKHSAAG